VTTDTGTRLEAIRRALDASPKADETTKAEVRKLIARNREIQRALSGDPVARARNENDAPSISERVRTAGGASTRSLSKPTGTQKEAYAIAAKEFPPTLADLRQLVEVDLPALEKKVEGFGAPPTPGRLPKWEK
jgi:hypothetical protein